ncbi:MAG: hypothetical protein OET90_04345 [Desulfuromonadales bacterium]|nr:hypothetical protein [Desulfuromonadales bacterium]
MKKRSILMLFLTLLLSVQVHAQPQTQEQTQNACWHDLGMKERMFGSFKQAEILQTHLQTNDQCEVLVFTWQKLLKTGLEIDGALFYDMAPGLLWVASIKNMEGVYHNEVSWTGYNRATKAEILAMDTSYGFDLKGRFSGNGVPPFLTDKAQDFVRNVAPKRIKESILRFPNTP